MDTNIIKQYLDKQKIKVVEIYDFDKSNEGLAISQKLYNINNKNRPSLNEIFRCKDKKPKNKAIYESHF